MRNLTLINALCILFLVSQVAEGETNANWAETDR